MSMVVYKALSGESWWTHFIEIDRPTRSTVFGLALLPLGERFREIWFTATFKERDIVEALLSRRITVVATCDTFAEAREISRVSYRILRGHL